MCPAPLGAQPSASPGDPAICALGETLVKEQAAARPGVIFDGQAPPRVVLHVESQLPPDLRAGAAAASPSNLFVACPSLAGRLPDGARMATDADRAKVQAFEGPSGFYVTSLSAALIDRAGQAALVTKFSKCPGLCGNGGVYLYRREGGRWVGLPKPLVSILS